MTTRVELKAGLPGLLVALVLCHASAAEAGPSCPQGAWASSGSCCDVGSEYIAAKNQCMPVRAERRCVAGHLDDCVTAARELEQRGAAGASYSAELYRYACEEGYAPACRGLGSLYHRGLGLGHDEARARVLYQESCDGGDAPACTLLARLLLAEGQDALRAQELLTQACHRGDADACDLHGRRLSADPQQRGDSAAYLERACTGGVGSACRGLVELARRDEPMKPARERELLEQACKADDAAGCTLLGDVLREAAGAVHSSTQAALRYRAGCEGGHAPGCLRLAELTFEGRGVKRDLAAAGELFGRACGAGVAVACEKAAAVKQERERERSRASRTSPPASVYRRAAMAD